MKPQLPVTIALIIAEFDKRGVHWELTDSGSPSLFMQFADPTGRVRYLRASLSDTSSAIGLQIADDKLMSAAVAKRLGLRTPETVVYQSFDKAADFARRYGQVVVKPLDSAHGNGVTVGVTAESLEAAIANARQFSKTVVLQQQVGGRDVRLLFIGGKLAAAAQRTPASVTGDGTHTVQELITETNASPDRGEKYQKKYNRIPEKAAQLFLGDKFTSVPAAGETVQVVGTANGGTGGTAADSTDTVASDLVDAGRKLVNELRLGVCGVDFIASESGAYFIELNTAPGFRMHHYPHEGQPRNVAAQFVDFVLSGKEFPW
ncbi:MAG TPA: hypothetical protein VF466_02020 [Candidatus Saccharimonadales bacterium]